jgi:Tfp pilus assembly protein PilV
MKCAVPRFGSRVRRFIRAFTLLEVMIALTLFFMAVFAILGTVTRGLGAARSLQQKFPDIGSVAADLMLTNRLEEGSLDGDFGDSFPGYTWRRDIQLVRTNGFFQVDFVIQSHKGRQSVIWTNSIFLWRPDSRVSTVGRQL